MIKTVKEYDWECFAGALNCNSHWVTAVHLQSNEQLSNMGHPMATNHVDLDGA